MSEELYRRLADMERRLERLEAGQHSRTSWTDWTPTITQSGAVTCTVTMAKYMRLGSLMIVKARLAVTGTGTGNNYILIGGLPTAGLSAATTEVVGSGMILDSGTAIYSCAVTMYSTTQLAFLGYNISDFIGVTPNFALANGDSISFSAMYRV